MALSSPRWQAWPDRQPIRSSPPSRRWPLVAGIVLGLLTVPPIWLAALRAPAGTIFSGYVVVARDAYVYQAMWRAGWHGAWLFHSAYTSESLAGILLYAWYLWPAHLVGWAAGPWLYHMARLAAVAVLLYAIFSLTTELFRPRLLRRWALVLCALGGGIGVLLPHDLSLGPLTTRATEMSSPGSSVADLIAMAPHLPWAMALMCWTMVIALRLRRAGGVRTFAAGLAAVIGLQLIYPQLALLAMACILLWSLLQGHRRVQAFALAAALVQLPYAGYLAWVWRTAPEALSVIRPALDVGDPFGFIVLSHLVATGLIGVALWRGRLRGDLLLPGLWIVGMTVFMFAPGINSVLGRSFMASSVPFGLCATPGLLIVLRRLRTLRWRRRVLTATLAASSLFGLFSLAQPYWIAAFRLDPLAEYESRAEAILLERLAPDVSAQNLVLATYLDGIFVPAQTDAHAYAGHPEMTIDAGRKSAEVLRFFTSWSVEQRRDFLRATGVDYVLATNPDFVRRLQQDPNLVLVDDADGAALFLVLR